MRLEWKIRDVVWPFMFVRKLCGTIPVSFMKRKMYKMFVIWVSDIVLERSGKKGLFQRRFDLSFGLYRCDVKLMFYFI